MRIRDRYAPALVCVMIALGSSRSSAISVGLLTQDRSISASAGGCSVLGGDLQCANDSDNDAAVDFGLFDSTVSASSPDFFGSAFASQLSTLTSSQFSASVHTSGSGSRFGPPNSGTGDAASVFRVSFSVAEAVPYTIQGSHLAGSLSQGGDGSVTISLRDSVGSVLWEAPASGEFASLIEFAHSGVLAPGDYLLEARASSSGDPAFLGMAGTGTADFSFEFSIVPEPSTATVLGLGLALLGLRTVGDRKVRRRPAGLKGFSEVTSERTDPE